MASDFVRNIKDVRNIDILSPNITTENDLISTKDGEVYVVTKKGYRKITGVETKEIKQLKTDVSNVKKQSDTNTSEIETLKKSTGNNTSEIEKLQKTTDNNTSEIDKLKKSTGNNTSEIDKLKTSTGNNTSEIEKLQKTTDNNTSEIETLKTSTSKNEKNIDSKQTLIEQLQKQIDELKSNTKQHYTLFDGSANGVGTSIDLLDSLTNYNMIIVSGRFPGGRFNESHLLYNNDDIAIIKENLSDSTGAGPSIYEILIELNSDKKLIIKNEVFNNLDKKTIDTNTKNFTIQRIEGWK